MKTVFIVLICLFTGANISSGEWIRLDSFSLKTSYSEYPLQLWYVSIRCADSLNCAAVANTGSSDYGNVLCRTTNNGGKTWKLSLLDTSDFYSGINHYNPAKAEGIVYPDKRLALILCDSGYYYVSRDSCNTWEKKKLPTNDVLYLNHFLNAGLGIVGTYKEFFITHDSARTFERINIYDSITHLSNNNIFIVDTNIMYLVSSGPYPNFHRYLFKSNDFGKSFKQMYDTPNSITDIFFWNENKGVLVGRGKYLSHLILMTSNGGVSWESVLDTVIPPANGIRQIIVKENNAFCLGIESILWRSPDTCKSWTKDLSFRYPALDVPASSIAFRTKDKLLVTSLGNGTIWEQDYSKLTYVEREILIDESVFLFPNPATDFIEISVPVGARHALPEVIRIYNVFGQEVNLTPPFSMLGEGENNPLYPPLLRGNLKIDVSGLAPGLYFVRVGERVGKFLKI